MNKRIYQFIAVFFVAVVITGALLASGYAANTINRPDSKSREDSTCNEELSKTMDDMHMQMQMVKSSGNLDEDFVRLMIPHHQAAIEMSKVELLCGTDPVNRRLAQEIIVEQQSEIDLMRLWLSKRDSQKAPDHNGHQNEDKNP